jgi:hypothetical protein
LLLFIIVIKISKIETKERAMGVMMMMMDEKGES